MFCNSYSRPCSFAALQGLSLAALFLHLTTRSSAVGRLVSSLPGVFSQGDIAVRAYSYQDGSRGRRGLSQLGERVSSCALVQLLQSLTDQPACWLTEVL